MSEDHVIISKPVREIADPLLDLVEKTYTSSFPEEERRDFSLVRKLLEEDSRFEMYALLRDGIYVGFITGWQFEGFVYAEHFAIDESARNGGIGAKAMTSFLALHEDPVVLEVEMPTEEMSKRRIGFYERLGFVLDHHVYFHLGLFISLDRNRHKRLVLFLHTGLFLCDIILNFRSFRKSVI